MLTGRLRLLPPPRIARGSIPRVLAALLGWLAFAAIALAAPDYPALTGRVVDGAALLTPEVAGRIDGKIAANEAKSGDQLVVATVPSLQGVTIEDYANGLFRHWRLGQEKTNNGVLLLVAPNERKVRIEVGYGLEGALTDALASTIITSAITPKFRTGDFAGGIEAGVDAILSILAGDAEEWQRRAPLRSDEATPAEMVTMLLVAGLFLFILGSFLRSMSRSGGPARRHRLRNGRWVTLPTGSASGWGGGGWGGGGGWSSGSGGFGGGGGSSGGGGASGSW